jgi:PAS domain S-box-containing protein
MLGAPRRGACHTGSAPPAFLPAEVSPAMDPMRPALPERMPWRWLGLALAIVLIVLLPYVLAQRAIDGALHASDLVAHTARVKAETADLIAQVRDMEAAAFALAAGMRSTLFRERLRDAMAAIDPRLASLKRAVADNPEQLVRVGRFEALVAGRRKLTEEALLEVDFDRYPQALAALDKAADQFRIRDLSAEIVAVEEALLQSRVAEAAQRRRTAGWLAVAAAAAQLLLLAGVTLVGERQVQRRLAAESQARQAQARTEAIFRSVREPIVVLDAQLRVLLHNDAFAEVYGALPREADPPPALAALGAGEWNDAVLLQRLADVATRGRELWDHELHQRHSDGVERILAVNARRMRLPDREDTAVLMTVADVSAHKRAEGQIRELNRQLEGKVEQVSEVNRELEAFSYSVSHDLRAPLRHIAGFSTKLESHLGERLDDKSRHYLDVIGGSAQRMAGLIDDLLVYSRLGRHALRLQAVDTQTLVEEARQVLSADLDGRRVEWRVGPLPIVVADENMMRQVWQNLLGNALKYTGRRELAVIEVAAQQRDDGSVHFQVRDNGAGFDMAYAGKLFGVFQRLHKSSDFPGSGIGLANVRRILTRHGGRIWAEAAPDQGATFHFTLPPALGAAPDTGRTA